jgi:hypothetical protein
VARLAALLDVPPTDPDLAAALRRLTGLALIWPHADGLATAQLRAVWPHPLDLGRGVADALASWTIAQLRGLAKVYGVAATGRGKDALIAALAGWLAEPQNVRRLVAGAPADVRAALGTLARRTASPFSAHGIIFGSPATVLPWAAERGLLVGRSTWGGAEMPSEIALALREGYAAPFEPRPPVVKTASVEPETAEREAAAAAAETLAAVTAVVETMSAGPVSLLKTGGLGQRELRRITKSSGQDEDRTRLTIELLAAAGLTEASPAGLTPAAAYDEFAAAEPAEQLLDIVGTWLDMPASPLAPADSSAASARLLYWDEGEEMILSALRVLMLRTLVDAVPEGHAVESAGLADRLSWQSPVLTGEAHEELPRYVTGIWREAHRLGLLAHGAVSRLGRALLTGDVDGAHRQVERMLPRPRGSVLLQNDLTAVVTGTPSAGLLALLDSAAAPESRSGAWTWRFSPATVRAALDAGTAPADLLARLTEAAESGRVPQTLAYLIDDVARQHGRVQVRPAGCCVCGDDETLLTEILNTRSLRALQLVRLAPTVLVSAKPQAETLAALRAAGYAPAGLQADGGPAIELRQRRRAAPPAAAADADAMFPLPAVRDPAQVARSVLGVR